MAPNQVSLAVSVVVALALALVFDRVKSWLDLKSVRDPKALFYQRLVILIVLGRLSALHKIFGREVLWLLEADLCDPDIGLLPATLSVPPPPVFDSAPSPDSFLKAKNGFLLPQPAHIQHRSWSSDSILRWHVGHEGRSLFLLFWFWLNPLAEIKVANGRRGLLL